jgi:hypothetical protein
MRRGMALAALVLLAACGKSGGNESNTSITGAFDEGFKKTFREKFVEQCVSSAQGATKGVAVDFNPVCTCSADKLLATKSVSELMAGPTAAEGQAVMQQCLVEHPFKKPGT